MSALNYLVGAYLELTRLRARIIIESRAGPLAYVLNTPLTDEEDPTERLELIRAVEGIVKEPPLKGAPPQLQAVITALALKEALNNKHRAEGEEPASTLTSKLIAEDLTNALTRLTTHSHRQSS